MFNEITALVPTKIVGITISLESGRYSLKSAKYERWYTLGVVRKVNSLVCEITIRLCLKWMSSVRFLPSTLQMCGKNLPATRTKSKFFGTFNYLNKITNDWLSNI